MVDSEKIRDTSISKLHDLKNPQTDSRYGIDA